VLFALGANDLFQSESQFDPAPSPTAEEYKATCQKLIDKIHAYGAKALAFTIYPGAFDADPANPFREAIRQSYNEVIRSGIFDDYFDNEDVLKHPSKLGYKDGYGIQDGVHLSVKGGKALADSIDLERLVR
jgi:lysophospholipase L1-like esterase